MERLHVVVLQFDIRHFIQVQESVSVTMQDSWIFHATFLPVRKRFSFCATSLNKDCSLEVSVDDVREAARSFRVKDFEVCLLFCPSDRI